MQKSLQVSFSLIPHTHWKPLDDRAECSGMAGYFTTGHRMTEKELAAVKGRSWEE
jgi:hypothetical protein